MKHPVKKLSQIRLFKWYLVAITLFAIITLLSPQQLPVVAYKLSLVLLSAVVGYHLDRALFPYASPGGYLYNDWKEFGPDFYTKQYIESLENNEQPEAMDSKMCAEYPVLDEYRTLFAVVLIRRALIVSAVILGVTLGL
ncbi:MULTISPECIES: putative holin [unclassified Gilliamella]|uniref:putative holin n=1 Tax=unclassified Gilliamella TaxID=2685620 RepID=UPI0018DE0F05|nr:MULTISPECIES: putative holin [unclassified Gilliamella]MBI0114225.1 putative holin [Gilliamella sp. W8123]MBI0117762.1 putative holin [Gilliamella sp. W8129]